MNAEDRLHDLAGKILDGSPIDWQADTAGLDEEAIEELRALAAVAVIHRDLARAPLQGSSEAPRTPGPLGVWGSLHLIERIGGGAFGEVFRAWDPRLDREVALKLLHPSASPQHDQGVITEGRLLARVRHPNVVTAFGAELLDGRVGIWTEFIQGRTLSAIVEEGGPLTADTAIAIGVDLCRALGGIHEAGLVHGDVKAQNVIQEPGGRNVLVDLGTGREHVQEVSSATPREISGTPLYMAPELWQRTDPTPRSDIYSLGVLLYYLVTGTYPIRGTLADDVRAAHDAGRRIALRDERRDLPARFVKIVERALEPDPSARFETAAEFGASLERAASAAVRRRRTRWAAALYAVAATTTVILLLGWSGTIDMPRRARLLVAEPLTFQPPERPILAAAVSPDGAQLAYADLTGLFTRTISTGTTTRLNSPIAAAAIQDIAWTFDAPDLIVATAKNLWRLRSDSSSTKLADIGGGIAVSPNRRHLSLSEGGRRLLVMTTDGEELKEVVAAESGVEVSRATWSPDGRRIAYVRHWLDNGKRRAAMASCLFDGTDKTIILGPSSFVSLAWLPNGRIVYSSHQPGGGNYTDLWQIDVDQTTGLARGTPRKREHAGDLNFVKPGVTTAEDTRLVFTVNRVFVRIFVADFDATRLEMSAPRQAVFTDSLDAPIAWTPAGDAIFFNSAVGPGFGFYRQPVDRPEPVRMLGLTDNEWPAVSPDGAWIYFRSAPLKPLWSLMRIPTGGGQPERLFEVSAADTQIKCSHPPVSRCVVASSPPDQTTIDVLSFDPRQAGLPDHYGKLPGYNGKWDVSWDNLELAYLDSAPSSQRLHVLNLETRQTEYIAAPVFHASGTLAWTRDRRGWIVTRPVGRFGGEVFYVNRATMETSLLWKSDHRRLLFPTVSPDGTRVLFAAGWTERNVMMIRGF